MKAIAAEDRDELVAALTEEHRRLDERIRALEHQRVRTPSEEVEYSQLKKQKLRAKDQLTRLRASA